MENLFTRGLYELVRLRRRMRGPRLPSWDARYETLATLLHSYAKRSIWLPLSVQRSAATVLVQPTEATEACRYDEVTFGPHDVRAEWFRHDQEGEGVLIYLHGGGYSIGSIETHRDFIARLCREVGVRAFAIDYRLAPEHRFPAQLEDAVEGYRYLLAAGHDPSRILVAGESAGGGLTLSLLVRLRELGVPLPTAAAVISPWVDLENTGSTVDENAPYDYLSRRVLETYARRFVASDQRRDPLASPLHADLSGLPPLLVHAGAAEVLADDAVRLAARAEQAGVEVEFALYPEMIHAFHLFGYVIPQAQPAVDELVRFLRSHLEATL